MIILTIFSLILLYKMHGNDSKASNTFKTFGFLDLICSWGLIFFGYIIILLYTIPNGKENFVNIITLKNGIAEFSIIAVFIILGILSIIHLIKHIIKIKRLKLSIVGTLIKHLLIAITFMITIPIYYWWVDPYGELKKSSEKVAKKREFQREQFSFLEHPTSYTDSLGHTTYYDKKGRKTGTSYTDSFGKTTYYDE